MQKIVLLGAGNVATHLFKAFQKSKGAEIVQVYNRSEKPLEDFRQKVSTTTLLSNLKPADVYVVSVSDDAVQDLIEQIPPSNAVIAHTSGSVPLLKTAKHNGVFYPLQTFSKQIETDFLQIPICVEASSEEDYAILKTLGESISNKVFSISTEQRKSLHLAAVFACNFTNHLYRISEKICEDNNVPFETLYALIGETARKVQTQSPKDVQTGPAKRHDEKTLAFHLDQLDSPDLKEIYTLLTRSIQRENDSKL